MRVPGGRLRPFPWRETAYLASGLVVGLPMLIMFGLALLLSALVVVLPAAALPALGGAVWLVAQEPARLEALLGHFRPVPRPMLSGPDARTQWHAALANQQLRRWVGYAMLRLPLSLLQTLVMVVVLVWPLMLLASLIRIPLAGDTAASGPLAAGSTHWPWPVAAAALGALAVLILVAPRLIRLLTIGDVRLVQWLLAPRPTDAVAETEGTQLPADRDLASVKAERVRIERDLHDGAQQRLIALGVSLGRAEARLRDSSDNDALELVRSAKAETLGVVADIRALARGLRPAALADRGLGAALASAAAGLALSASFEVDVEHLDPATEAVLYFAVCECLTNAAKHAPGASVAVRVQQSGARVSVEICDDGPGGAVTRAGGGLAGVAQRLADFDGALRLASPAGGPTVVRMELPCGS